MARLGWASGGTRSQLADLLRGQLTSLALAPRLSADLQQQGVLLRQVFSNVRNWPASFLTYRVFQLAGPALAAQPEGLFEDAFAAARTIPIRDRRAEAVTHIVRVFNKTTAHLIERAVATVEGSREPLTRLAAMAALAPALSGPMLAESLELAWSLPLGDRALSLAQLAPFVPNDQRVQVALDALAGQANYVPRLGEILRGQDDAVLHQALDAVMHQALDAVTSPDWPMARVLISLTPALDAAGQAVIDRAADLAAWVPTGSARAAAITALAPLLPRMSADLQKRLIEACPPDDPLEPRSTALEAVCSAITDHDEALAFARSIPMPESRTRALAGLAAREGTVDAPGLVSEALDIAFLSPDPAPALEAIAGCIGDDPAIANAAIERAMALVSTEQRCLSLLALAPVLGADPAGTLPHAFRWCLAQPRFWQFLPALSRFPAGLRSELLAEASQAVWALSDPEDGIDALLVLADLLPPANNRTATLWDVAERLATVPQYQHDLARRLQELSCLLVDQSDDLVAEVIRIASHHPWDLRQDNPFEAISLALRGRPESLVRRAIDAAEGVAVARDEALASVAAALPDALMDHALRLVDDMRTPGRRAALLAELLPRCAPLVQRRRVLTAVGDARPIMDEQARVQVLGRLLEAAFETTFGPNQDVANLARTILPAEHRYRVLLAFARRAKGEDRRALAAEALAAARAVPVLDGRARAIVEVAADVECQEPDVLMEALAAARDIKDDASRAGNLARVAKLLTLTERHAAIDEALAAARQIQDGSERVRALHWVLEALPAERIPATVDEIIDAARSSRDHADYTIALQSLAEHSAAMPEVRSRLLSAAKVFTDKRDRGAALVAVAACLDASLLRDALASAQALGDDGRRARAMAIVGNCLAEPARSELLADAVGIVGRMPHTRSRGHAFTQLAPLLVGVTERVLDSALQCIAVNDDPVIRRMMLVALVPALRLRPVSLANRGLELASQITRLPDRLRATSALLAALPEPAQSAAVAQALKAARSMSSQLHASQILVGLTATAPEHLSESAVESVLAALDLVSDEKFLFDALSTLVAAVPLRAPLLTDFVVAVGKLNEIEFRRRQLGGLADRLRREASGLARLLRVASDERLGAVLRIELLAAIFASDHVAGDPHPEPENALAAAIAAIESTEEANLIGLLHVGPRIPVNPSEDNAQRAHADNAQRAHALARFQAVLDGFVAARTESGVSRVWVPDLKTFGTEDPWWSSRLLAAVTPLIGQAERPQWLARAKAAIFAIEEPYWRAWTLTDFAHAMRGGMLASDCLEGAFDAIGQIEIYNLRHMMLYTLAQIIPVGMIDRLLSLTQVDAGSRVSLLLTLSRTHPELAQDFVMAASKLAEALGQPWLVESYAPAAFDAMLVRYNCQAASGQRRRDIMARLDAWLPRLRRLEGDASVAEMGQTIREIGTWFP